MPKRTNLTKKEYKDVEDEKKKQQLLQLFGSKELFDLAFNTVENQFSDVNELFSQLSDAVLGKKVEFTISKYYDKYTNGIGDGGY